MMKLHYNNPKTIYELLKDKPASHYIDTMKLTVADIEGFCSRQVLDVRQKRKDRTVEHAMNPPLMVSYFFYYIDCYQLLPSQETFISFYTALNNKWMRTYVSEIQLEGLRGRLSRFYASIMREFHFYHLVRESGAFEHVSYTLGQDVENKVDVIVQKEETKVGVQLRVLTRDSTQFSSVKSTRGFQDLGITLIDLPIDLRKAKRVPTLQDDFLFYTKADVQELVGTIQFMDNQQEKRTGKRL